MRWLTSRVAVAHPSRDGRCPLVSLDIDETAASLEEFAPGDGDAWRSLYARWERVSDARARRVLLAVPAASGRRSRLMRTLGPDELMRFARFSLLPVRRMGEETFSRRRRRAAAGRQRAARRRQPRDAAERHVRLGAVLAGPAARLSGRRGRRGQPDRRAGPAAREPGAASVLCGHRATRDRLPRRPRRGRPHGGGCATGRAER